MALKAALLALHLPLTAEAAVRIACDQAVLLRVRPLYCLDDPKNSKPLILTHHITIYSVHSDCVSRADVVYSAGGSLQLYTI